MKLVLLSLAFCTQLTWAQPAILDGLADHVSNTLSASYADCIDKPGPSDLASCDQRLDAIKTALQKSNFTVLLVKKCFVTTPGRCNYGNANGVEGSVLFLK